MTARTRFRVRLLEDSPNEYAIATTITVDVPAGLTRWQACDYVTGYVAGELRRYAAWEALGLGSTDNSTDWKEIVT